jgi:hypothetical protein
LTATTANSVTPVPEIVRKQFTERRRTRMRCPGSSSAR